jgi:hypothetical protein
MPKTQLFRVEELAFEFANLRAQLDVLDTILTATAVKFIADDRMF